MSWRGRGGKGTRDVVSVFWDDIGRSLLFLPHRVFWGGGKVQRRVLLSYSVCGRRLDTQRRRETEEGGGCV